MQQIVLLRAINLGSRNRIAMPELRTLLTGAGFDDVRTYMQSGNIVLSSAASPQELARECQTLIAEHFGLQVDAVVRTRDELADVIRSNPLGKVAVDPRRYQVSFLAAELDPDVTRKLGGLAVSPEQFVAIGRELYAWHPEGVARSRLSKQLAGRGLGVTATARNWTTVTTLLTMADVARGGEARR
jgi:uncharacterized protein (DUF1697 family)